jgi:hypothetical protein
MDIGEAVGIAITAVGKEKDPTCDGKDSPKDWKSRVNVYNSQEDCTGTRLYENMEADRDDHKSKGLGVVPKKIAGTAWSIALCTEEFFPVQAHHLIPKNYLPKHKVCVWLAKKYDKDDKYQLAEGWDSPYDTDDADNGYCMPYATPLVEWGGNAAKKTYVAFQVMDKTKVQLHQGSHAAVLDPKKLEMMAGESIAPEIVDVPAGAGSDEFEQANIHSPGYLSKIKLLLNAVHSKARGHVEKCEVCKKEEKGGKIWVQPLESVATLMHQVSKIIKILVAANVMHVSGYAYYYAVNRKFLVVDLDKQRVFLRTTEAQLRKELGS